MVLLNFIPLNLNCKYAIINEVMIRGARDKMLNNDVKMKVPRRETLKNFARCIYRIRGTNMGKNIT